MMNNRKVICHEYAKKNHAKSKISLACFQGVSSSNEYAPICNTKEMMDIDLNNFQY